MRIEVVSHYSGLGTRVLSQANRFWENFDLPVSQNDLFRFSLLMGIFPFAGYLISYTLIGKIWNWWPFVRTTLPVTRGLMCAGLQWIFFAVFPLICSFVIDFLLSGRREAPDVNGLQVITTYSMTPLYLASMFVGVPFLNQTIIFLGTATFLYLLYFGFRVYLKQTIWRSLVLTLLVAALFSLIRQMFIYVIGI
jgi:hypothetical protein